MKNTIILAVATLFLVNTYTSFNTSVNKDEIKTRDLLKSESVNASTTGSLDLNTNRRPKLSSRFISGNTLVITYKGVTEDDFMLKAAPKPGISVKEKPQRSRIILPQAKNQIVEHIY